MFADEGIIKTKHAVLEEVARLHFVGTLEENLEKIPYDMIPGPLPTYRCCIYKEREVIRNRVRLAQGKHLGPEDDGNTMQVIEAACASCPLSSFVVTENCQNCVGKACVNSCKFDACTPGIKRSHIDPTKCRECGLCQKACPYNAIAHLQRPCKNVCPTGAISYNEHSICQIDKDKCIRCGHCIHKCPFGAIGSRSAITELIDALKAGKHVYALIAPSTEGMFGEDITYESWKIALKKLGFTDAIDLGFGGDLTASEEADEWIEAFGEGKVKTTSCCPAFVSLIRNNYPEFSDLLSETGSPMCLASRLIKSKDPGAVTVFIGPCVAKKAEAREFGIEGNADFAMIYSEIRAVMRAKGIHLEKAEYGTQEASVFGKRFGNSGGVTAAVLQAIKEKGVDIEPKVVRANGVDECINCLKLMKANRFDGDFMEGMVCEGGCVGGPSAYIDKNKAKKSRDTLIGMADDRSISESISRFSLN